MSVSVRIAPSPTGLLHIGNIRAALFNYLYARRNGGSFMLRLDDTDQERSTQEFAQAIEKDLSWLGLTWDRFARHSDRYARYTEALEQLNIHAALGMAIYTGLLKLEDLTHTRIPAGKVQPKDMDTVALMFATVQRVGKPRK